MNIFEFIILLALISLTLYRVSKIKTPSTKTKRGRGLVMDTSGLIDGRIVDIVKAGFMSDDLVIPQFIVAELQLLADGHDAHKRERARFGLDVVQELQHIESNKVILDRSEFPDIKMTDDKLVALSKQRGALLYTTDYNLAKVATVEGVTVLNVNELAQNLRPVALPGEMVTIKIVQKGSNPHQGVGYLDDGTMIVVDNAAKYIGKTVPAEVERMHQTVAGKMVFARLKKRSND